MPLQVLGAVRVAGRVVKRLGKGCLRLSAGGYSGQADGASEGAFLPHYGAFLGLGCLVLRGSGAGYAAGMALTEKQAAFVEGVVARGLSAAEAARQAGFVCESEGWRLTRLPAIQAEIARARAALIAGDGARLAWRTMSRLMEDGGTPPAVQFQAARWVLEASGQGLAARIAERVGEPEKALAEMSLGELEAFISRGRDALAGLRSAAVSAVPVTVEAVPVPVPALASGTD